MQHQDWDTVEWRRTMAVTAKEAQRRRLETDAVRKRACGGEARKIASTEIGDIKRWGKKRGQALAQARTKKGLSQAALARSVNEKPGEIAKCESGKAKLNNALINKLRRVVGPFDMNQKG